MGFTCFWLAEHHSMLEIAVSIEHVACKDIEH
jgi:hypothetical protein